MAGATNRTSVALPAGLTAGLTAGLARAARSAREADLPDPLEVVRGVDLAKRVEAGRELAVDAASAIAEGVTGNQARRRRSRRRQLLIVLTVGVALALAMPAWRAWRRMSTRKEARERRLDRTAIDRAADEGMGTAIGSPALPPHAARRVPVAMERSDAGALTADPARPGVHAVPTNDPAAPAAQDERVDRTVIDQSTIGIGAPRA